jgi:hypothetical protein
MSFSVVKEPKMAANIFFSDSTLATVLKGLRILSVLRELKLEALEYYEISEVTTMKKSSMFQLSRK